jgi:glutaredoxin
VNLTKVIGSKTNHKITVYSLLTCEPCSELKKYLKDNDYSYEYINVDKATRDEKREVTQLLKKNNLPISFPLLQIDDKLIQGFNVEKIEAVLKS